MGDRIDPVALFNALFRQSIARAISTRRTIIYRYDDDLGYLYRIDRDDNIVQALIPLFGGYGGRRSLAEDLLQQLLCRLVTRSYYYDTPDYYYRYDGNGDLPDRCRDAADHRAWSRC